MEILFYKNDEIAKKREEILFELNRFAKLWRISLIEAIEIHKLAIPEAKKIFRMKAQLQQLERDLKEDGIDFDNI